MPQSRQLCREVVTARATDRAGFPNTIADQFVLPFAWAFANPSGQSLLSALGCQSLKGIGSFSTQSGALLNTNKLVETVDDFVAVQSLLVQQRSTSLNT